MDKTPRIITTIRIKPELYHALRLAAARENRSVNNMIETALEKFLKQKDLKKKIIP